MYQISFIMKHGNLDGRHGANKGIKLLCFPDSFTKPLAQYCVLSNQARWRQSRSKRQHPLCVQYCLTITALSYLSHWLITTLWGQWLCYYLFIDRETGLDGITAMNTSYTNRWGSPNCLTNWWAKSPGQILKDMSLGKQQSATGRMVTSA